MSEGQEDISHANDDLSAYQNKAIAISTQLVTLNKALNAVQLTELDADDIMVRLEFVEKLNKNFDHAQATLEEMDSSIIQSNARCKFMTVYFEVKAKLTRQLNILRNTEQQGLPRSSTLRQFSVDEAPSHFVSNRSSRLPELKLPSFSGSYLEWSDFYSMFCTVIDKDNMPKIEKLQHLRACLKGAALDAISSLEPTDANYDEAIELLKRRFDNKLVIFQSHIKEIFNLNRVERDFAVSIRQLSDKLSAHMRALQTMCTKEQIADGLLIHLVTSKFDLKSKTKWEEGLSTNTLPTWASLEAFLDKRCRFLETIENFMPRKSISQNSKNNNHGRNVLVASTLTLTQCWFCNAKDHFIAKCSSFENLSPNVRFKEVKRLKLCINCLKEGHLMKNCKAGHCRHCTSKHHSLLHIDSPHSNYLEAKVAAETTEASTSQSALISSSASLSSTAQGPCDDYNVLLATAIVLVKNASGSFIPCRAILDSASQLNFITTRFAEQLQLKTNKSNFTYSGIGDNAFVADKFVVVTLKSQMENFSTYLSAVVVPSITDYKPNISANVRSWNIPQNLKLADPFFYKNGRVDILIGASLFFELICVGQIRLNKNLPILQKTLLGWVVSGGRSNTSNSLALATTYKHIEEKREQDIGNQIKKFWEIENNFDDTYSLESDDAYCETFFKQTTIRLDTGEYSVNLPKAKPSSVLGDSFEQALQRFKGLERKLNKSPDTKRLYTDFMNEYIELKHMSLVPSTPIENTYYLPHHCVRKEDSTTTKLRVVFDGSAKTSSGVSLNDILYAGPTIQSKLFNTVLRFRLFKVALTGDICKMYRCVKVSTPDDYLQCILWRENPSEDIKIFKLNTVTYGTKPAAFLAIRAMHQLSYDEENNFPMAAKIIRRDFYVDDMISGSDSVDEVIEIRHQVTEMLKAGNFLIRKWCSNEAAVLEGVLPADCEQFFKFHDGTDITKTLGLVWNPKSDDFIFSFLLPPNNRIITKRSILSIIARIYDPLGLIGPVITKAKLFMQILWKYNLSWDESLPQSLHSAWLDFITKLSTVDSLMFPRFVQTSKSIVQIHAFCDASLVAYGACVYVCSELDGVKRSNLLCSKSRVSPLKTITIPKLELSAALLLAELVNVVLNSFSAPIEVHCWSDSMIVLSWLREKPSNFNVFVANRVSRIQNLTNKMNWHHVPTALNPADILSRGALPEELLSSKLWKNGPNFLENEPTSWPKLFNFIADLPERKRTALIVTPVNDWSVSCKYHNSFSQMQLIFGYVYKFVVLKFALRKETKSGPLTSFEIKMGTNLLIRNIQKIHFSNEYNALKANKTVSSSSKLYPLAPFIDSTNLIRVGGRLENSDLNFEAKHPIVLPKLHPFTRALVMDFHHKLLHAGPQCLLATIRLQYWPLGGRKAVSAVTSKCIRCFRLKPKYVQHIMGNLPRDRVLQCRTFYVTGIDFCGPFYYKSGVRKRPPVKSYVCIFICFATKATHMELVSELSTAAFLAALKRFISIRGKPHTIWSDNATNFVGAKNELSELKQLFINKSHLDLTHQECLNNGIDWKFIPPRSPHFGGLWESAVKAAKYHLKRVLGLSILSFDELRTLVYQVSAILNSRPLCPISDNPNDLDVITPGHFLIGAPLTSFVEPDITDINISRLNRWQHISFMQQMFWKKWSTAYLTLLQERSKWRTSSSSIAKGDMVLLKDENIPPLQWKLGRVIETILGEDGVARVAVVRTSTKEVKRAVARLAVLPMDNQQVESQSLPTGGGCLPQSGPAVV